MAMILIVLMVLMIYTIMLKCAIFLNKKPKIVTRAVRFDVYCKAGSL
jgi:hypothetical protein